VLPHTTLGAHRTSVLCLLRILPHHRPLTPSPTCWPSDEFHRSFRASRRYVAFTGYLVGLSRSGGDMPLLLYGMATGIMWLRTLNFVLVQQDLGQVSPSPSPAPSHSLPPPLWFSRRFATSPCLSPWPACSSVAVERAASTGRVGSGERSCICVACLGRSPLSGRADASRLTFPAVPARGSSSGC
jgi:hypothetical protein